MEKESEIQRLENYVERLLEGYTSLKAEKKRLERDIQETQDKNDHLQKQLDKMDSERGDVSSRVGTLIDRIEQWESELEPDVEVSGKAEVDEQPSKTEDSEEDPEKALSREEERSGGVQGSLFTTGSTA